MSTRQMMPKPPRAKRHRIAFRAPSAQSVVVTGSFLRLADDGSSDEATARWHLVDDAASGAWPVRVSVHR